MNHWSMILSVLLLSYISKLSNAVIIKPNTNDPSIDVSLPNPANSIDTVNNEWDMIRPINAWGIALRLDAEKYSFQPGVSDSTISITVDLTCTGQCDAFYAFSIGDKKYSTYMHDYDGGLWGNPGGRGGNGGIFTYPACGNKNELLTGNPSELLDGVNDNFDRIRLAMSVNNDMVLLDETFVTRDRTVTFDFINNDIDDTFTIKFTQAGTYPDGIECVYQGAAPKCLDFIWYQTPDTNDAATKATPQSIKSFEITSTNTGHTEECFSGPDSPAQCVMNQEMEQSGKHFIVVGRDETWENHSSGNKPTECTDDTSTTGVGSNSHGNKIGTQCCAIDGSSGWRQNLPGGVDYLTYKGCLNDVTYDTAKAACEQTNGRLCTAQEVEDGVGQGTGCNHDAYHVWTSTQCGDVQIVQGDELAELESVLFTLDDTFKGDYESQSEHDVSVYFNGGIYECTFTPNGDNEFLCGIDCKSSVIPCSTMKFVGNDCNNDRSIKLVISNPSDDYAVFTSFKILTSSSIYYGADSFCGTGFPHNFEIDGTLYEDFLIDGSSECGQGLLSNYDNICISNGKECVPSTLVIEFDSSKPNENINNALIEDNSNLNGDISTCCNIDSECCDDSQCCLGSLCGDNGKCEQGPTFAPTPSTPSPTNNTPSPTITTPSPTDSTPSPTNNTPSPTDTTPSPTDSTPSPTNNTPSPIDITSVIDECRSGSSTTEEPAVVWGDPHYKSFIGNKFNFQGSGCYYYMTQCPTTSNNKLSFNLRGMHWKCNSRARCIQKIFVDIIGLDDKIIETIDIGDIDRTKDIEKDINSGGLIGKYTLSKMDNTNSRIFILNTNAGNDDSCGPDLKFKVKFSKNRNGEYLNLYVSDSKCFKCDICGLLSIYSPTPNGEYLLGGIDKTNIELTRNINKFGYSWFYGNDCSVPTDIITTEKPIDVLEECKDKISEIEKECDDLFDEFDKCCNSDPNFDGCDDLIESCVYDTCAEIIDDNTITPQEGVNDFARPDLEFICSTPEAPSNKPTSAPTVKKCNNDLSYNYAFLFDESKSVKEPDYISSIEFVERIINEKINDISKFAALGFGHSNDEVYSFMDQQFDNKQGINTALNEEKGDWDNQLGTDTKNAIIAGIEQFENSGFTENNVLMLVTDGKPACPNSKTGPDADCDLNICGDAQLLDRISNSNIRILILGITTGFDKTKLSCLVENEFTDIFEIKDYSEESLNNAFIQFESVICPPKTCQCDCDTQSAQALPLPLPIPINDNINNNNNNINNNGIAMEIGQQMEMVISLNSQINSLQFELKIMHFTMMLIIIINLSFCICTFITKINKKKYKENKKYSFIPSKIVDIENDDESDQTDDEQH